MKISHLLLFSSLISFSVVPLAWAKTKSPVKSTKFTNKKSANYLQNVDIKYGKAKSLQMKVNKKVFYAAMETEKNFSGNLFASKGNIRLEFLVPARSIMLVNKTEIWAVSFPSGEEAKNPGKPEVIHIASKKGKTQQAISALLGGDDLLKTFSILGKTDEKGKKVRYRLKPKSKIDEIEKIEIVVDKKREIISLVEYWDEIENKTTYELTEVTFNKKLSDKLFTYTPPVGVKVEEL